MSDTRTGRACGGNVQAVRGGPAQQQGCQATGHLQRGPPHALFSDSSVQAALGTAGRRDWLWGSGLRGFGLTRPQSSRRSPGQCGTLPTGRPHLHESVGGVPSAESVVLGERGSWVRTACTGLLQQGDLAPAAPGKAASLGVKRTDAHCAFDGSESPFWSRAR